MSLMAIHKANARMHKEIKAYKAEIDALQETLFKIGEFLAIDYRVARKAEGKPSDVYISAIKAQRDALLAAQQWRDIESAPRDGTDFLIDYEGVTIARWQPDGSPFPWIFLDTDDGKFIFNRFRESVEGLVWQPKPLGWEASAKARGDLT